MRLGDLDALKKEFINEFYTALGQGEDSFDVIGTMAKVIDTAPTVIVDNCGKCPYYGNDDRNLITEAFNDGYNTAREKFERPQGEWIEKVERRGCFAGDRTVYSYTCPFCGANEFKKYPFCHCGADMRNAEE